MNEGYGTLRPAGGDACLYYRPGDTTDARCANCGMSERNHSRPRRSTDKQVFQPAPPSYTALNYAAAIRFYVGADPTPTGGEP